MIAESAGPLGTAGGAAARVSGDGCAGGAVEGGAGAIGAAIGTAGGAVGAAAGGVGSERFNGRRGDSGSALASRSSLRGDSKGGTRALQLPNGRFGGVSASAR